jgi:hypothetical protein
MRLALGAGLLLAVSMAMAQRPGIVGAQVQLSSGGLASDPRVRRGEIVREIDDPHTGKRWLLMRDERYPGGPGRMVLAGVVLKESDVVIGRKAGQLVDTRFQSVIRAGDRLTVEEHTAVVDAVLEARALAPAALGGAFDARLMIGGRVVRVVALGPGRAALQPENGVR